MVVRLRQQSDAVADAQVLGHRRDVAVQHLLVRAVRVLVQEVVLYRPKRLESHAIAELHLLDRVLVRLVLLLGRPRFRDRDLVEHRKFHGGEPTTRALRRGNRVHTCEMTASAKRRSNSIFSCSGWVSGSDVYGYRKPTIASVTPRSSSRCTPSIENASSEIACTSNGSAARPYSARSAWTRCSMSPSWAGSPPAWIQPSPMRAARRSATPA